MAITQNGNIKLVITSDLSNVLDLSTVVDQLREKFQMDLADGTGLGQANNVFHDRRQLADGANESLDFAGGLTNAFGVVLTFTKVKAVIIVAASTNTTSLTISRPASNGLPILAAASDALAALKPGGFFAFGDPSAAGVPVTAGTGDLLNIANGAGAAADYDVVIFGAT